MTSIVSQTFYTVVSGIWMISSSTSYLHHPDRCMDACIHPSTWTPNRMKSTPQHDKGQVLRKTIHQRTIRTIPVEHNGKCKLMKDFLDCPSPHCAPYLDEDKGCIRLHLVLWNNGRGTFRGWGKEDAQEHSFSFLTFIFRHCMESIWKWNKT